MRLLREAPLLYPLFGIGANIGQTASGKALSSFSAFAAPRMTYPEQLQARFCMHHSPCRLFVSTTGCPVPHFCPTQMQACSHASRPKFFSSQKLLPVHVHLCMCLSTVRGSHLRCCCL